jgi:hypothetical protein
MTAWLEDGSWPTGFDTPEDVDAFMAVPTRALARDLEALPLRASPAMRRPTSG